MIYGIILPGYQIHGSHGPGRSNNQALIHGSSLHTSGIFKLSTVQIINRVYIYLLGLPSVECNIATASNIGQLHPLSSGDWGQDHLCIQQSITGNTLKQNIHSMRFLWLIERSNLTYVAYLSCSLMN